jgi:hypothetical protein
MKMGFMAFERRESRVSWRGPGGLEHRPDQGADMPAFLRGQPGQRGHQHLDLRVAGEVTPAVTRAAPALTVAVQLYDAEQYPAAMSQLSGVVAMLHQARHAYPALPPL